MSESKEDMQNQLNVFNDFCKKWKLKVNERRHIEQKYYQLSNNPS
jgi:nucleoid-associated protein YejK